MRSAENELSDAANGISDAMRILRELQEHAGDTDDRVCGNALLALDDAQDHLDDVITALSDGRLPELTGGGT